MHHCVRDRPLYVSCGISPSTVFFFVVSVSANHLLCMYSAWVFTISVLRVAHHVDPGLVVLV